MKKPDVKLEQMLRMVRPELERKYGVNRLGYFNDYTNRNALKPCDVNIIVELAKPMGWKFFEMKGFLEKKLARRIDVVTSAGLKVLFRPQILPQIHWV